MQAKEAIQTAFYVNFINAVCSTILLTGFHTIGWDIGEMVMGVISLGIGIIMVVELGVLGLYSFVSNRWKKTKQE